jgi:hypothetical protein
MVLADILLGVLGQAQTAEFPTPERPPSGAAAG